MSRLRSICLLTLAPALIGVAGCTVSTDASRARAGVIQAGNQQTQPAGTAFPIPLAVLVLDQYNFSAVGVGVTWTITAGGGSLSATSTVTDGNGVAQTVYTAGATAGTATITADIAGVGKLTFSETIT